MEGMKKNGEERRKEQKKRGKKREKKGGGERGEKERTPPLGSSEDFQEVSASLPPLGFKRGAGGVLEEVYGNQMSAYDVLKLVRVALENDFFR